MLDPAISTAALASLETLIRQALRMDPAAQQQLAAMQGKTLHIQISSPVLDIYCQPGADGIKLKGWCEQSQVDSKISGSLSAYIKMLQADDSAAALINGELNVHGRSADFVELQSILSALDLDWEEPLSRVIGDVAAHQLGKLLRGSRQAGRTLRRHLQKEVAATIEDSNTVVRREELEQFYSSVAALRQRVERFDARIARTRKRVQQAANGRHKS